MLAKSETRRGLRISIWEGAAGQVHAVLVGNAFLTGFALCWGANDFHLGMLGALAFLAQMFQMVGAYAVDRWADQRREVVAFLGLLARSTWFLMAVLPFLLPPVSVMPAVLLLFFLYQMAYCASGPGWVAWLSVLVPSRLRGRYLGRRNLIIEVAGVVTVLSAGYFIDHFRAADHERVGFAMLQVAAGAAGLAGFFLLRRQPDPGHRAHKPALNWSYLLRPFRDLRFRRLALFNLWWCFGLNVSAPFLNAHLIKNLFWDFKHLALLAVITSAAAIVMNPLWGRLADRYGYKPVLKLCSLGLLHVPLYYVFCPLHVTWPIYLSNILNGVFLSGFTLALFSLTLGSLPTEARAMGAAVFSAVTGPATFISGALSGWLAEHMAQSHWVLAGWLLGNYQLLFLLSILIRLPTLACLNTLCDPTARRTRDLLRGGVGELKERLLAMRR